MKPLSIIAFVFAVFLIILGILSRRSSGGLSNAVIVAGVLVLIFLAVIWILYLKKEKKEATDWEDLDDSE
jgi:TRAP-type C4-dicarboxylate transport system permease large subunit